MNVQCKNCLPKEGIEVPDCNRAEKLSLSGMALRSPLHSTKYIMEHYDLSHRDAKYIVTHINKTYGHCNSCTFDQLDEEYINCPRCGALNFNWKTGDESWLQTSGLNK